MRRTSLLLSFFGLLAIASLPTTSAHAQATRTWVSGVGDDANPCSRTAPCKTFAGAISKTATGGEINCPRSGRLRRRDDHQVDHHRLRREPWRHPGVSTNGVIVNAGVERQGRAAQPGFRINGADTGHQWHSLPRRQELGSLTSSDHRDFNGRHQRGTRLRKAASRAGPPTSRTAPTGIKLRPRRSTSPASTGHSFNNPTGNGVEARANRLPISTIRVFSTIFGNARVASTATGSVNATNTVPRTTTSPASRRSPAPDRRRSATAFGNNTAFNPTGGTIVTSATRYHR